jgi:hypothetical protein
VRVFFVAYNFCQIRVLKGLDWKFFCNFQVF